MVYVTHDQVEAMTLGQRIVVLKDGIVQQVDTPLGAYQHPANRFVAGFIGSPAMNFLDGKMSGAELIVNGLRFSPPANVSGSQSPAWSSVCGGTDSHRSSQGRMRGSEVVVDVVEPLGNEILVYAKLHDARLVIRGAPTSTIKPDDRLQVFFDPLAVHYFDGDTDAAL